MKKNLLAGVMVAGAVLLAGASANALVIDDFDAVASCTGVNHNGGILSCPGIGGTYGHTVGNYRKYSATRTGGTGGVETSFTNLIPPPAPSYFGNISGFASLSQAPDTTGKSTFHWDGTSTGGFKTSGTGLDIDLSSYEKFEIQYATDNHPVGFMVTLWDGDGSEYSGTTTSSSTHATNLVTPPLSAYLDIDSLAYVSGPSGLGLSHIVAIQLMVIGDISETDADIYMFQTAGTRTHDTPEPGTLGLLGAGFLGLRLMRRRLTRKS